MSKLALLLLSVLVLWETPLEANTDIEIKSININKRQITAYHRKDETTTISSTYICISPNKTKKNMECTPAQPKNKLAGYDFGLLRELSSIKIGNENGVIFVSENETTIDGLLRISIWLIRNRRNSLVETFPETAISAQSEYKLFQYKGNQTIFVVATRIWDFDNEYVFAPHKFKVSIYRYSITGRKFGLIGEYSTNDKYDIEDSTDRNNIILKEWPTIVRFLQSA